MYKRQRQELGARGHLHEHLRLDARDERRRHLDAPHHLSLIHIYRQTGLIIHPAAWRHLEEDGIAGVQSYAQLALHTLGEIKGKDSPATANLRKMNDYFVEVEKRMRGIMQWFDEQKKLES